MAAASTISKKLFRYNHGNSGAREWGTASAKDKSEAPAKWVYISNNINPNCIKSYRENALEDKVWVCDRVCGDNWAGSYTAKRDTVASILKRRYNRENIYHRLKVFIHSIFFL